MFSSLYQSLKAVYHSFFLPYTAEINNYERGRIRRLTDAPFRLVTPEHDPELYEQFSIIAKKAKLARVPKLIVVEYKEPNACCFANGTILVTTGLLKTTTLRETKTTLAHEITHLFQKKTRLAYVLIDIAALALATLGTTHLHKRLFTEKPSSFQAILGTTAIFTALHTVSDKLFSIPFKALMRFQEYDADRGELILTGDLDAIKSKFQKREAFEQQKDKNDSQKKPESTSSLKALWSDLQRTHPRHEDRLSHLEKVKKQMDAGELKDARPSRFW
jgi:Zn-dependent protease with chaperone function